MEICLPAIEAWRIANLVQEYGDLLELEAWVNCGVKEWMNVLPNLRDVVVVVHYRGLQAYGQPFKPTKMQVEERLQGIRRSVLDDLKGIKEKRERGREEVLWKIPNIRMESCRTCFGRQAAFDDEFGPQDFYEYTRDCGSLFRGNTGTPETIPILR